MKLIIKFLLKLASETWKKYTEKKGLNFGVDDLGKSAPTKIYMIILN